MTAALETGLRMSQSSSLLQLAGAYGKLGETSTGRHLLTEALTMRTHNEQRYYRAELHRLKGELLLQQSPDNQTEAETTFHQALDIARQPQARSWELRAATSLARLWQSRGKRQDAYALLQPVYGWFTKGFDTIVLKKARTLLDELAG
jgi:predicted ATPase